MKKVFLLIALALFASAARAQTSPGPSTADVETACPIGYYPIPAFQVYDASKGQFIQGACYNRTGSILYYDNTSKYQTATAPGVSGSGTTNIVPKWTSASGLGNSSVTDNGTNVSLTEAALEANGTAALPSYSFTNFTGAGLFAATARLSASVAGAEFLRLDSTANQALLASSGASLGFTSGANVGALTPGTLTAARTWTLPDAGGTIAPGPAAPVTGNCVKWAAGPTLADQGGVCGSTVTAVNLTAQGANIAATTLVTPGANGFFRFSCYVVITQAATTSSTIPVCSVKYTDADSATLETINVTAGSSPNTVGSIDPTNSTVLPPPNVGFFAKSGVAIQYLTTGYASAGATAMQYAIHIRLEGPF